MALILPNKVAPNIQSSNKACWTIQGHDWQRWCVIGLKSSWFCPFLNSSHLISILMCFQKFTVAEDLSNLFYPKLLPLRYRTLQLSILNSTSKHQRDLRRYTLITWDWKWAFTIYWTVNFVFNKSGFNKMFYRSLHCCFLEFLYRK